MAVSIILPNDPAILDHVETCTAQIFAFQREGGSATAPPPGRALIQELLTLACAASLEREEGRTVAFTLCYEETAKLVDYVFKPPPPLTPRTLARLSAALEPLATYICVTSAESALVMVGIRHWGSHHTFRAGRGGPSNMAVRVVGPGVFVVRYDVQLVLTYRRGEVAFYPVNSNWYGNARRALCGPVRPYADEVHTAHIWQCVVHIAECMLRLEHGGALLILPNDTNWEARVTSCAFAPAQPVVRVHDAEVADIVLRERCQALAAQPGDEQLDTLIDRQTGSSIASTLTDWSAVFRLDDELEWLAHLTATDGMAVIRPDLTLLGFGVFFSMEMPSGGIPIRIDDPNVAEGTEPASGDLSRVGGARHQSAAVTCHAFPGATAIVVSQDGDLSAM